MRSDVCSSTGDAYRSEEDRQFQRLCSNPNGSFGLVAMENSELIELRKIEAYLSICEKIVTEHKQKLVDALNDSREKVSTVNVVTPTANSPGASSAISPNTRSPGATNIGISPKTTFFRKSDSSLNAGSLVRVNSLCSINARGNSFQGTPAGSQSSLGLVNNVDSSSSQNMPSTVAHSFG